MKKKKNIIILLKDGRGTIVRPLSIISLSEYSHTPTLPSEHSLMWQWKSLLDLKFNSYPSKIY
jgi:hypothetical protein